MDSIGQLEMLVVRCQIGERSAFKELFERYQWRLRYYVRRLDHRGNDTDDTLQDVWLTVLRKIHKLKDPQAFQVWLYRIARNKVYGRFRKKPPTIHFPIEELSAEIDETEPDFSPDDAAQIHKALNKIQPDHREVLTLYILEEMSYVQIAEVIGCNLGTVKSRMYYAKQSLRKEMESDNG